MCTYQAITWGVSIVTAAGFIAAIISLAQDHFRRDQEEQS
jgi:hypothetical protein